jgi:hypothetical protein
MPRYLGSGLILFGVVIFGSAAAAAPRNPAPAPTVAAVDRAALAGSWNGTWASESNIYDAVLILDVDANGNLGGTINWTLRSTPSPNGKDKIGMRVIEYVRGKYYSDSEAIVLEGYRKDDPYGIWELDKYRLILAPTHETMGGLTEEHGSWAGQFFLRRGTAATR